MSMSPVTQPIYIFRKDAIHLWPETLISIVLLAAFAWMQSKSWPTGATFDPAPFATGLLGFLIPVSWLVLISRLVHDEELVGDRQFWITRPYTWYGLLAAKVLYLVVFILVPFALMQAWMLHHAGLYATHGIPGILRNLEIIGLIVLLPLLAIAAVTATFVRYMLSAIGALIYLVVTMMVIAFKWGEKLNAPFLDWPVGILCIGLLLAALIAQYYRRKTLIARLLLVALPLALVIITAFTPLNWLTAKRYPDTSVGTLTFLPGITPPPSTHGLLVVRKNVLLQLPASIQLPDDSQRAYVEAQTMRVTLDGPNGLHYVSDWTPASATFGHRPAALLSLILPEDIYNQVHDKSVALHIVFGIRNFTNSTPYTVAATTTPFPIPGNANCKLQTPEGTTECTFPFKQPEFSEISATVHDGNCTTPGPHTAQAAGGLSAAQLSVGFFLGLTPVGVAPLDIGVGEQQVGLCPNTPLTFISAIPGTYARMHLDIPTITLDPYAVHIPAKRTQEAPPATDQ